MSPLPPTRDRPVSIERGADSGLLGSDGVHHVAAPSRARRWMRRLGVVVIVSLAVVLGAAAALVFYAKNEIDDFVTPRTAEMRAAQRQLEQPLPGKPTNILLLGSDHRKSVSADDDKRSDTLLLVRLDPKRKSISMISFPRDLWVQIPGHGEGKINDAYHYGGPALSVQTIKQVTGLDVNMVMNVDFTGFRGVVDQLGGVWVDVDRTYFIPPETGTAKIDVKPGYQLLKGRDALDYSRFRSDQRGDFNRIARQQQVLAGLKKQVGSSSLASNVPGLLRVFKNNTEVVTGAGEGGDGVKFGVIEDYLRLALALDGKDVYEIEYEGLTGEASNGASIVVLEQEKMKTAVAAFLAPNSKAREKSADQLVGKQAAKDVTAEAPEAAGEKPAPTAPDPSTVSVRVLNGSGIGGAAGTMAQALGAAGYKIDPAQSNADNANYASTRVVYQNNAAKPAAEALASGISGATTAAKDLSNEFSTQLLVIVGKTGTTFTGEGSGDGPVGVEGGPSGGDEHANNKVPEKAAPKVTKDAGYGKEKFVGVSSKRFTIMYPAVREESSTFEEVYSYQFARAKGSSVYDAYRLVAKTANSDYWGVQGTSWPDPPILEGPTREVQRAGRTYKLYFNGTKLHMVAWRQGKGTYWVSNSVLNDLSNETMLAIADGVKPLR
ncbi:MAG: LCP family protein [Gaiellales bacterium]